MVKKQSGAGDKKSSQTSQPDKRKSKENVTKRKSIPDVDRPGFDLDGSTGKTSAGTGIGLGQDASDSRSGRSLPGRRGNSK